jgi:hypothetical protein
MNVINAFCKKFAVPPKELMKMINTIFKEMSSVLIDLEHTIPETIEDNEYSSLSVAQLKKLCKERQIKKFSSLNKPQLIEKLMEEVPGTEQECNGQTRKGESCKSKNTSVPEQSEFAYCSKHIDQHETFEQPSNELVMDLGKDDDVVVVDKSIQHQHLATLSVADLRDLCKDKYHIAITTKMTKMILIEKIEKKIEELEDDTPVISTKIQKQRVAKLKKNPKQEPYFESEDMIPTPDMKVLKGLQCDTHDLLNSEEEEDTTMSDEEEDA